jgi:hypothetical protein
VTSQWRHMGLAAKTVRGAWGMAGLRELMRNCVRRLAAGLVLGPVLLLGACAHHHFGADDPNAGKDDPANVLPANYKPDILAAMHAYLNDPTGIRDAGIAEPALRSVGDSRRYVVCLRLTAKKNDNAKQYAAAREMAAVFVAGRFDHFADPAKEACAGASYAPFPEMEALKR